jgi:hypothetical protein
MNCTFVRQILVQVKETPNLIRFLLILSEKLVVNNRRSLSKIKHYELALIVVGYFLKMINPMCRKRSASCIGNQTQRFYWPTIGISAK